MQNLHQKLVKNQSKIIEKSIKNRSKIIPGGVLERLGTVLGRPRGLDPVLKVSWSRPWSVLGRLGGVLEASWVPTWVPKWSQDSQKIDLKIDHLC